MHKTTDCCDDKIGTALWHTAYCAWFHYDCAGRPRRAAAWGWVADRLVRWA